MNDELIDGKIYKLFMDEFKSICKGADKELIEEFNEYERKLQAKDDEIKELKEKLIPKRGHHIIQEQQKQIEELKKADGFRVFMIEENINFKSHLQSVKEKIEKGCGWFVTNGLLSKSKISDMACGEIGGVSHKKYLCACCQAKLELITELEKGRE
jgi:vacuolar-type H+-ATPase subunit H